MTTPEPAVAPVTVRGVCWHCKLGRIVSLTDVPWAAAGRRTTHPEWVCSRCLTNYLDAVDLVKRGGIVE